MNHSHFFPAVLLLCCSLNVFAQSELDETKMVGFACFFEGRETKVVSSFAKLLKHERYQTIRRMLQSENSAERLMAVLCVERLGAVGKIVISMEEKVLIDKTRTSTALVDVCSGCFPNPNIALNDAFNSNILWGSSDWLDRNIKK